MSSVKIDKRLNRLTIILAVENREELQTAVAQIKAAANELEPDLTCLTDFRQAWPLLSSNGDLLKKAQLYLQKVGLGKAVRVINPGQFNTPAYEMLDSLATGYQYAYATSLEEGKEILDNFRRELMRGGKVVHKGKTLFKYMDRSGWEQGILTSDFYRALQRLKKLRKQGRRNAIIVNAGFKQRA